MEIIQQLLPPLVIPTIPQAVFIPLALFTAICALGVSMMRNLFHSALCLVGTFFGVAGLYALLEAEFLAVSQVLIYVGAISTLITFAIMLTRGMMFGNTSPSNRQVGSSAIIMSLFFVVLGGLVANIPWPKVETQIAASQGEAMIAKLGTLFVTNYLIPFELMALLLLVALAGALLLARDRK